jgi:hypothetical protein
MPSKPRMGRKRQGRGNDNHHALFDKARDELFSHILNCGVIEADATHQQEWFDDTMDYLAQRYPSLSSERLASLRGLGERYCKPVIAKEQSVNAPS